MLRLLVSTTWRATLWGGGIGAALGALYGVGLLLVVALLTGPGARGLDNVGAGLNYGLYIGLLAGLGLGLVNGVVLGCALSVAMNRSYTGRPDVRRYTALSIVFNALIVVVVVASLPGSALFVNTFSVAAASILVILATGGAAWVDTRIARSYVRSVHHRFPAS